MGLNTGQEPSEPHPRGLPMDLISAQPNRARLNRVSLKATPIPLLHHRYLQGALARQGLPLERTPNSDKGFATNPSNLPAPPNLPLHSQTHSPTQLSLHTLKCLQSNQLRIQKEAPTGSNGWQAQLTATFWDAITHQQCVPQPRASAVPRNSGKNFWEKPWWHH